MWFIISGTIILLILIDWFYNEFFGYWKKLGVPHPCTLPLIGNLAPGIKLTALTNRLIETYNKYTDCLYVGFYQFQKPTILIRDIELIKTVAIREFSSFHDNQIRINEPIFGKNPFFLKGKEWKIGRAQVVSGLSNDKMKSMSNLMWIVGKNLVDILNQEIKMNKSIDIKDLSERYVSDIVALCLYGFEGNTLNNPNSEYGDIANCFLYSTLWAKINFFILYTRPYLGFILNMNFVPKSKIESLVRIFQKLVKYREINNISRNDYLDHIISLKSKLKESEFSNNDFLSRIIAPYIGAIALISKALYSVLYDLGQNFEVQSKLQKEIDETMQKCNGEVTYEELHNMNYLDMVLSESLRKSSPVLFMYRICTKEFTLPPARGKGTGPNVTLEIGTRITIPNGAIHNDPTYYPEPEKFIPERFSEEGKKSRPKCTYMPFGDGPRICLGQRLAITEIKVAVISILADFNIKLNPKPTSKFKLNLSSIFFNKKEKMCIYFNKR